jgi:porin
MRRGSVRASGTALSSSGHFFAGVVVALSLLFAASAAMGDSTRPRLLSHLLESSRLLGDPGGFRSELERLGIDSQLVYNQYASGKPSGMGADSDGTLGSNGSYDSITRIDFEKLAGWPQADMLFHARGLYDDSVNDDVGALSDPIDDADFDEAIYVDELWLQQGLFDRRLRLRLGFMEQQTIFDRNAYANAEDRQFLTTFLDNNGILPLPNGLAATLFVLPLPWLELAAGIADADNRPRNSGFSSFFDGVDSLNAYLELRLRSPWQSGGLPGAYRIGLFRDGRRLVDFASQDEERGHLGVYLNFDQHVWGDIEGEGPRLGVFARAGWADPDVNRIEWFWSAGFELAGGIPSRGRDRLGFGTYQTIASDPYQDEVDARFDRETGFELYYAIQALGWLVITPDLQYIVDPGATGENDDAFVGTLRTRVTF